MITLEQAKQLRNGDKVKVGELEFQITGSVSTDDRITVQMQNKRVGASFFTQEDLDGIEIVSQTDAPEDEQATATEPVDAGDTDTPTPKPKTKRKLQ